MKKKTWKTESGETLTLQKIDKNIDGAFVSLDDGEVKVQLILCDEQGDYFLFNEIKYYL